MKYLVLRRTELISIAIALVMLLAIAIFSSLDWIAYLQSRSEVLALRQVSDDTISLLTAVTEAESSQRGFLLTGNERYLEPWNTALAFIPADLDKLALETSQDPVLHPQVVRLRASVEEKLDELRQTVRLRRGGGIAASLEVLNSGRGAAAMEAIRRSARGIISQLALRIATSTERVRKNSSRSRLITVLSSVVLLILLALGAINISGAATRREQLIATLENERRQASEVRDLLKTTLFSIGDAVMVTDRQGRITYLNRVAESLTGWLEDEAGGQAASKVFHIVSEKTVDPVENPVDRILSGREAGDSPTTLIAKNGTRMPIDESGALIRTPEGEVLGVVLVFRDITNRRGAERERERLLAEAQAARQDAERQRTHLHSLFLQAPAIINIYRGPDHVFELLHPLEIEFFGGRDVTGMSAREVHRRRDLVTLLDAVYQTGESRVLHEISMQGHDRKGEVCELYFNYFCCPWREANGSIAGVMSLAIDVTEQVGIKRALQSTEERLRETAKLESLGILAGGIAHDFNNLLVGIIGNASLALEVLPHNEPSRDMIEGVVKAGERAAVLTRQMLAYSGKGRFVIEMVDLSTLVSEMLPLLKGSIPRTITLQTQFRESLPPIEADSGQIQQVFMNLVINGAEACGEGPGIVSIRTALEAVGEFELSNTFGLPTLPSGLYVMLEVSDSGSGMDEETKARIFDPFFTTKFTGRGLGLSAVLGIIRAHKGAIHVYSEPGHGSTFRVYFPAAGSRVEFAPRPATVSERVAGSGTVLLIDDEQMVRNMGRSTLERYGYRVIEAENGRAALDLLANGLYDIDLVILDLTMPVMSGKETLAGLRRLRPDIEVILSSGFSETEATLRFESQHLAGFLQKPYSATRLVDAVSSAMRGMPQPRTAG